MTLDRTFVERISGGNQRKDDITLIVDASTLINLASLINPQDVSRYAPDPNPTMLSYLEHLGKKGVRVIIPESIVYESAGRTADGVQLNKGIKKTTNYGRIYKFVRDAVRGDIENIHVVSTPYSEDELHTLKKMRNNPRALKQYHVENLIGFGDRDIATMIGNSELHGQIFVATDDKAFTDNLAEVTNQYGRPVGVINTIKLAEATQRAAPIEWLNPQTSAKDIVDHVNHHYRHENLRRKHQGLLGTKGLNRQIPDDHKGYSRIPKDEPNFDEALFNMLREREGRGK